MIFSFPFFFSFDSCIWNRWVHTLCIVKSLDLRRFSQNCYDSWFVFRWIGFALFWFARFSRFLRITNPSRWNLIIIWSEHTHPFDSIHIRLKPLSLNLCKIGLMVTSIKNRRYQFEQHEMIPFDSIQISKYRSRHL